MDGWPSWKQAAYHQAELQEFINRAMRKAEADYRASHPQANSLRTTGEVRVYRRPPRGFYSYPARTVALLLDSKMALAEPNAAFIERAQNEFAPYVVPGDLFTRQLSPRVIGLIAKVLAGRNVLLDLKRHNTLSKIKKALRARAAGKEEGVAYDLKLVFTPDAVIAGDKRYPIYHHKGGYQRISVGEQKLRVDVLKALAMATTE